jgi:hypothetical protein
VSLDFHLLSLGPHLIILDGVGWWLLPSLVAILQPVPMMFCTTLPAQSRCTLHVTQGCSLMKNVSCSASSLGMMSDEEKKMQRIEDIKELLS